MNRQTVRQISLTHSRVHSRNQNLSPASNVFAEMNNVLHITRSHGSGNSCSKPYGPCLGQGLNLGAATHSNRLTGVDQQRSTYTSSMTFFRLLFVGGSCVTGDYTCIIRCQLCAASSCGAPKDCTCNRVLCIAYAQSAYDYARLMWIAVEKQCTLPVNFFPGLTILYLLFEKGLTTTWL